MSCDFAHDDAAYVLGALAPGERLAFERHLADCAACATAVRELAGLPGLLSRVDPAVLTDAAPTPMPAGLETRLIAACRRERRRVVWYAAAGAAASAALAAGGTAAILAGSSDPLPRADPAQESSSSAPGTDAREMTELREVGIEATLGMESVPWGTRLDLTCFYPQRTGYPPIPPRARYALVVRTADGHVEQVATWRAVTGKEMSLTAATGATSDAITEVEIRDAAGHALLRLTLLGSGEESPTAQSL